VKSKVENQDVWVLVQQRLGRIEEPTYGLIAEAKRLLRGEGSITAVALGANLDEELLSLGPYGANRVLYIKDEHLAHYHGEIFSRALSNLAKREMPFFVLMAHSAETLDLGPRLAASLGTGLVSRAMDLRIDDGGKVTAIRPVANGYLFEELEFRSGDPFLVSFLPSVLSGEDPDPRREASVLVERLDGEMDHLKTELIGFREPDPETLDIEEADIIISGGRGVGKGEAFHVIYDLAEAIGGSVSGTRPVIDWQILPYDRQIGQTGKSVSPRLLFACGISGANEYTLGMEKSHLVIAINKDARARIFRFADLGVVGDVQEILPTLTKRLREP
jgi:electron transfer flavoprotein alpha subunit